MDEIKNKYLCLIILVIYICILLAISIYDKSLLRNNKMEININGKSVVTSDGVLNEKFVSKDDVLKSFSSHAFYDKISRKMIITSYDNILKIKGNEEGVIIKDNKLWYDIDKIALHFNLKTFVDYKKNVKYAYSYDELEASINSNRVEVFDIDTNEVIGILYNKQKCQIIIDEEFLNKDNKVVKIIVFENDGRKYVGNVYRQKLNYINLDNNEEPKEVKPILMTNVSNKLSEKTDLTLVNYLALDMLRIARDSSLIEEKYSLNDDVKQEIYGTINNGYRLSSFDASSLSNIVNSDVNKENIIGQIVDYANTKKLRGIIVDFNGFKVSDKKLIQQFIIELAANLHTNNKNIAIKVRDASTYDLEILNKYIDYVILEAHSTRTIASKTSGSHSSLSYVKKVVESVEAKIGAKKIILELAPYSILWTERAGTVINAEIYSMDMCEKYIKVNGLNKYYDKITGQNAINYTKGTVTYKMWLEDKDSILAKVDLAYNLGISNFSISKSGYEITEIYNEINSKINNKINKVIY